MYDEFIVGEILLEECHGPIRLKPTCECRVVGWRCRDVEQAFELLPLDPGDWLDDVSSAAFVSPLPPKITFAARRLDGWLTATTLICSRTNWNALSKSLRSRPIIADHGRREILNDFSGFRGARDRNIEK